MTRFQFKPSEPVILADPELIYKENRLHARLVFDTGATYTMISWAIAKTLDLHPETTRESIPFNTASGHVEAPLVMLDKLNLLGAEAKKLDVIVHDLPEDSRVDGLL